MLASLADLVGGVPVGVTSLADAGVASLADSGVASLADVAEGVTVGVTSLADLVGGVTVGVASLTGAGVASLADPAGRVAGGVTFLTDPVGVVTDGVAFLEGRGVWSESVVDGVGCYHDEPACFDCDEPGDCDICLEVTFLTKPVNVVSSGVTYQETDIVLDGSASAYVDYGAERGGWDGCPGVTRLADPVGVVTDAMTCQEKIEILSGSVYDYDDYFDNCPDYFDYDDPGDFDDAYVFVEPVEYGKWDNFHGPSDPGKEDDWDRT